MLSQNKRIFVVLRHMSVFHFFTEIGKGALRKEVGLTDEYIGMVCILTGLKHSQKQPSYTTQGEIIYEVQRTS